MQKILVLLILIFFIGLFAPQVQAFPPFNVTSVSQPINAAVKIPIKYISECGYLNASGLYILTRSVNSSGNCFVINASSLTLNCKNYTIAYATQQEGTAIIVEGGINNSIRECKIAQGSSFFNSPAIRLSKTKKHALSDLVITTTGELSAGFVLTNATETSIRDSKAFTYGQNSPALTLQGSAKTNASRVVLATHSDDSHALKTHDNEELMLSNSYLETNGSNAFAIFLNAERNSTFTQNTITVTGFESDALVIQHAPLTLLFDNNTIMSAHGSAARCSPSGEYFPTDTRLVLNKNKFLAPQSFVELQVEGLAHTANIMLHDQPLESYSWLDEGVLLAVVQSDNTTILFDEPLIGSGTSLSNDIKINYNYAFVDTNQHPAFDVPATIEFLNLPSVQNPVLLQNGLPCGETCVNLTDLNANPLIFTVAGWSNYTRGTL